MIIYSELRVKRWYKTLFIYIYIYIYFSLSRCCDRSLPLYWLVSNPNLPFPPRDSALLGQRAWGSPNNWRQQYLGQAFPTPYQAVSIYLKNMGRAYPWLGVNDYYDSYTVMFPPKHQSSCWCDILSPKVLTWFSMRATKAPQHSHHHHPSSSWPS